MKNEKTSVIQRAYLYMELLQRERLSCQATLRQLHAKAAFRSRPSLCIWEPPPNGTTNNQPKRILLFGWLQDALSPALYVTRGAVSCKRAPWSWHLMPRRLGREDMRVRILGLPGALERSNRLPELMPTTVNGTFGETPQTYKGAG